MERREGIACRQVRRYTADDCDDTIAIFVAAIREVASRDYSPAEIEA